MHSWRGEGRCGSWRVKDTIRNEFLFHEDFRFYGNGWLNDLRVIHQPVSDRRDGNTGLEKSRGINKPAEPLFAAARPAAAVNHQRRRLVRLRLPEIKNVLFMRTILHSGMSRHRHLRAMLVIISFHTGNLLLGLWLRLCGRIAGGDGLLLLEQGSHLLHGLAVLGLAGDVLIFVGVFFQIIEHL